MRDLLAPDAPGDSVAYAESLYRYAAPRLDRFTLRCWIIQRLMLDDGIDHGCAEEIVGLILSKAGEPAWTRRTRRARRHAPRAAKRHSGVGRLS